VIVDRDLVMIVAKRTFLSICKPSLVWRRIIMDEVDFSIVQEKANHLARVSILSVGRKVAGYRCQGSSALDGHDLVHPPTVLACCKRDDMLQSD